MKVRFYVRTDRAGSEIEETIDNLEDYLGYSPEEFLENLLPEEREEEIRYALKDWMYELIKFGYEFLD